MSVDRGTHPTGGGAEGGLSVADFDYIATYAKRHFGLNLAESKRPLVHSRISRRLRQLGLRDFGAYRELLDVSGPSDERTALLSALTTNVTDFFREQHHFDTLRSDILPNLVKSPSSTARLRVWSAGCSTGQEPYSIAMTILDFMPAARTADVRILATDIDPAVVEVASKGRYALPDLNKMPDGFQKRFTRPVPGDPSSVEMVDEVKSLLSFGVLNLIDPLPVSGPFDVIFCRNVAIYFDKQTQQSTWKNFCDLLAPGGTLFIGHSERVSGPAENMLKNNGITTYLKSKG